MTSSLFHCKKHFSLQPDFLLEFQCFYWNLFYFWSTSGYVRLLGTNLDLGPHQAMFDFLVLTLIMAAQSMTIRWSHIHWSDQTRPHKRQSLKMFIGLLDPDFEILNRDGFPLNNQIIRVKIGTWYPFSPRNQFKDLVCKTGTTECYD